MLMFIVSVLGNSKKILPVKLSIPRQFGQCLLPALWDQFEEGSLLFQHDCAPVHKARSINTCLEKSGVEEHRALKVTPSYSFGTFSLNINY